MICTTTIEEESTFHVDDVIATPMMDGGAGSLWMFGREKQGKSFVLALLLFKGQGHYKEQCYQSAKNATHNYVHRNGYDV